MTQKRLLAIGGDKRQIYAVQKACAEGNRTAVYGFDRYHLPEDDRILKIKNLRDGIKEHDMLLLPLPMTNKNGEINMPLSDASILPEEFLRQELAGKIVFGGKMPAEFVGLLKKQGAKVFDYMEREEFAVLNAVPTAEGAISIALSETPCTLFGAKCLVAGYGRIGKVLARYLRDLGALVTVSARKYSDLAYIRSNRIKALPTDRIEDCINDFDIIFNTVPALIFTDSLLQKLKPDALLIDLASLPGGIDLEAAKRLFVKTRIALGLPGKTAPKSSGEIIWDTVKNIIEEEKL